ncbi:ribonuclease H-like domain-containing protein [Tanacetum coccineum]
MLPLGGAKGGRITGKGTLKIGKLDFEDVYFVKQLQFNLFSVSQMCDKKNSVLFTNTECFVLSPDFKLANESQVLLKVPKKNNMYSVDMRNIIPKESLTCLVAKVTLDELMLWHRRLGHINFKNINKLVKDNLARASKDETSSILKKFIVEIENLVDKKVKIIRCDNGIEFKNSVMNGFCAMKVVAGTNSNDFAGTEESASIGHSNKETGSSQNCILMPLWKYGSLFGHTLENASNNELQPSSDAGKKDDAGGIDNQEKPKSRYLDVNTARQNINIASANDNTGSLNINTTSPTVSTAPPKTTHADFFRYEIELDISNVSTTYPVPTTPNTRIHKDQSLGNIIGDV